MSLTPYSFIKVEDFFSGYQNWDQVEQVTGHIYDTTDSDTKKRLGLTLQNSDGGNALLLLRFIRADTLRIRFNPTKQNPEDYLDQNSRSVVMDTMDELCSTMPPFTVTATLQPASSPIVLTTAAADGTPVMRVTAHRNPFYLEVEHFINSQWVSMLNTQPGIFFAPLQADPNEKTAYAGTKYSVIQGLSKHPSARYFGFGEHPGKSLCKNGKQLTYFNFDNMQSKQVYGQGAEDDREPLYHTNTFFMEFNGANQETGVTGLFVDNVSESFMDVGQSDASRMLFGSLMGDLDYYCFCGTNAAEVLAAYTSIVGHTRLKPRWALGYHQGCYGYESGEELRGVAGAYRYHNFPIDGLHIDVDIQHNYQTFTIDEAPFPNPRQMFSDLRDMGYKCSTNITPIISNLGNPPYPVYLDAESKDYLVKEERTRHHYYDQESHQNYSGGNLYTWNSTTPNIDSGVPYVGKVNYGTNRSNDGCYPDLGRKEVRIWWGEQYRHLYDIGISMVWQDMTSPAIDTSKGDMKSFPFDLALTDNSICKYNHGGTDTHPHSKSPSITIRNLYSYNLHKATYHGLNNLCLSDHTNTRNFIIGRGGFTGMHRFAALWTGDNASRWEFYRVNIPQVLSLGISGQSMIGQDIGGFEKGAEWECWADPQLFIRWMCTGALLPWFRNHYIAKEGCKWFQEPYRFIEQKQAVPEHERFFYDCVLPTTRHYVELRYRLMQLFYDALFENTVTGQPIVRPLFFNDGDDTAILNDHIDFLDNEFFVGKDLLIAPITEPQGSQNGYGRRDIYLPAGSDWYAFMNNCKKLTPKVTGGATIQGYDARIDGDLGQIPYAVPIYVRAGAILPTIELEQYIGERANHNQTNPITLNIYPGESGTHTLYLDDGISRSSAWTDPTNPGVDPQANDEYRQVDIAHQHESSNPLKRKITITRSHDNYPPNEQFMFIAVLHEPELNNNPIDTITINGTAIPLLTGSSPEQTADQLAGHHSNAYYYNQNIHISFIKVFDDSTLLEIVLSYR